MTDTGTLDALATAVEGEKQSLEAYLRFAWQTRDASGRAILLRLALDEFLHMRLLEQQEDGLRRSGSWQPVTVEQSDIERLVPHLSDRSLRIRGTAGQTELSSLEAGLDAENAAVEFYRSQGGKVPAGEVRAMFDRLAEMEEAHAALIQAEIDNIQQTGFWFGSQEFTLESER